MCSSTHSLSSFPSPPTTKPIRFSLLPIPRTHILPLSPFKTHFPKTPISLRLGSSTPTRAALNDNSVAAPPPLSAAMSFYELLGIPETGSLGEIKQAYKQLARKYHPDVSPPGLVEEYTKKFIRVQEAYQTLSDPGRRALYDQDMAKGLHLAFSARKSYTFNEKMEDRGEWKNRWQSQLSELKRRSMYKEATGSMSWAERVRRQRNESSS